jgi:hypothetical protein
MGHNTKMAAPESRHHFPARRKPIGLQIPEHAEVAKQRNLSKER